MTKKTKLRFGVKPIYERKSTRGHGLTYIFEQLNRKIGSTLSEQTSTHQHLEKKNETSLSIED